MVARKDSALAPDPTEYEADTSKGMISMVMDWRRWVFVGAGCVGLAWQGASHAKDAIHDVLQHYAPCESTQWEGACRIAVSNADFAGLSGDNYYHGGFSWTGFNPRRHGVAEHIRPWKYDAKPGSPFHAQIPAGEDITLHHPGDRIFQKVTLLPSASEDIRYTLHVYVRGEHQTSDAVAGLFLVKNRSIVLQSIGHARAAPATGEPTQAFTTHLVVPAGTEPSELHIALGVAGNGVGPVVVDDVTLLRSPTDLAWSELVPVQ